MSKEIIKIEDAELSQIESATTELTPTGAAAEKQFEIQSAIVIAKRFPRNEDTAYAKILHACKRPAFADEVAYSYPRGKKKVVDAEGRERCVDNYIEGP